jgi:transcriptional regulator with XRE-family HTH domain
MSTENPTPFNVRLGAAVRARRIMAGLSQEAVGQHLGVTFQQQQKYEKGKNRISVETLVKLAEFLGVTPQRLIMDALATEAADTEQVTDQPTDRYKMETIRRLFGLSEKRQHIAVTVIKALETEQAA